MEEIMFKLVAMFVTLLIISFNGILNASLSSFREDIEDQKLGYFHIPGKTNLDLSNPNSILAVKLMCVQVNRVLHPDFGTREEGTIPIILSNTNSTTHNFLYWAGNTKDGLYFNY